MKTLQELRQESKTVIQIRLYGTQQYTSVGRLDCHHTANRVKGGYVFRCGGFSETIYLLMLHG